MAPELLPAFLNRHFFMNLHGAGYLSISADFSGGIRVELFLRIRTKKRLVKQFQRRCVVCVNNMIDEVLETEAAPNSRYFTRVVDGHET